MLRHPPPERLEKESTMQYDSETHLLISIYQKANPLLDGQSTSDYLDYFGYPISVTEGALERLGLAEHDKQSGFGVKLTPRFMRMIADRGVHRPKDSVKTTTLNDRCLIASIFNVSVGEENDAFMDAIEFGCKVLAVLGLLHQGEANASDATAHF